MSNQSKLNGTAVSIAYIRNKRLNIDTEKIETILNKVGSRPLSVISINGPMRTGKSLMLGYFLRYLSNSDDENWFTKELNTEFHWQNSAERQTTGILMWSEPFFINKDGKEVALLLMDTQGCFDDKTTTNENSQIFSLSCLLSSDLIYNIKSQLTEDVLQFLQLFIGYAKLAGTKMENQSFSKLIFLIRDWQFPKSFGFGYHDDSGPANQNFKKDKLDVKLDMIPEVRVVREEIASSFQSVCCCLVPHPGNDLAVNDDLNNLDAGFQKVITDLIPRICGTSSIATKKIGGHEVTGHDFMKFIHDWARHFAEAEIPEVTSLTESMAIVHNEIAHSIGLKFYQREITKVINEGIREEHFEEIHEKSRKEAFDIFKRLPRLKHEVTEGKYYKRLEDDIQTLYERFREINLIKFQYQESKEGMKKLEQLVNQIKEKSRSSLPFVPTFVGGGTSGLMVGAALMAIPTVIKAVKPEGQFTISFINCSDKSIEVSWNSQKLTIEPEITKSYTFKSWDNLFTDSKFKTLVTYDDKIAKFWAFGENAPRRDNTFKIKSDGIYLDGNKHANWE